MRKSQNVVQELVGELPLECHVVNRKDGANAVVQWDALVELAEEDGGERRLPIVAVKDIAFKPLGQMLEGLGYRFGEEGESLAVVKMSVRVIAFEIALVVDKEIGDSIAFELLEPAVLVAPAQWDIEIREMFHLVGVFAFDRAVFRHHDDALGARSRECRR